MAAEFGITALKARKLLLTAGVYSTALSRQIAELQSKKMKLEKIMNATGYRERGEIISDYAK